MGFFHSLGLFAKVSKIQKGGTENLSVGDVAMVCLNMSQAQRNLPANEFRLISSMYKGFVAAKEAIPMDCNKFDDVIVEIYKAFDEIAPLEAYTDTSDVFTNLHIALARDDKQKADIYRKKILEQMLK